MSVMIHGKEYITVAERVTMAHQDQKKLTITTEVLSQEQAIVVKATVTTEKGVFTGISAANPSKAIEKQSPYEVAETSAVGRALGFAGYGATESIASADEVQNAVKAVSRPEKTTGTINPGNWMNDPASEGQRKFYLSLAKQNNMTPDEAMAFAKEKYNLSSFSQLTKGQATELIDEAKKVSGEEPPLPDGDMF